MRDDHTIEDEMARLARDPRLQEAMRAASSALSEEELLRYYSGELSAEEARRVGRLAALSPEATRFLAELEADAQAAAGAADPRTRWQRLLHPFLHAEWSPRMPLLRLAGGGLAVALALLLIVPPLLDRSPEYEGGIHRLSPAFRMGQGKSVATLPGDRNVGLVDPTWPLVEPQGRAAESKWLVWAPVEGAVSYRLELIDASGGVLFARAELREARVKIPPPVRRTFPVGVPITWLVEAVDAAGEVMVRAVGRFTFGR